MVVLVEYKRSKKPPARSSLQSTHGAWYLVHTVPVPVPGTGMDTYRVVSTLVALESRVVRPVSASTLVVASSIRQSVV